MANNIEIKRSKGTLTFGTNDKRGRGSRLTRRQAILRRRITGGVGCSLRPENCPKARRGLVSNLLQRDRAVNYKARKQQVTLREQMNSQRVAFAKSSDHRADKLPQPQKRINKLAWGDKVISPNH